MQNLFFIFVLLAVLWFLFRAFRRDAERRKQAALDREASESRRLSECEKVVRYFANYQGYIARSVVSREELEEQIDSSMSSDDLCSFIAGRISAVGGIELGFQGIGRSGIPVILPEEYRDRHIYVIGKSGYGKTNFLRYMIIQDLEKGNGIGVLAPEYEMLTEEILPFIPENRVEDVIYFNPADLAQPVVLNPLHIEAGEDIDLHVDEAFTILQRIAGEGGPRMDEILRHTLYALMERPGSTLLDIEPLLDRQDVTLRNEVIRTTSDEQTRQFFQHIYPQFPKDAHFPVVNRIGRIIRARFVRNCLCPPKDTSFSTSEVADRLLNIRRAMDESKILLFNLSDGILGEAASQLIGQFIVSKFQTATMSRANEAKQTRKPFYLYLDEFQNFCGIASKSYEKILSRARKYKLGLILAHQQTGQIPLELLREIFGNVSTMVSFQVSQPDSLKLSKEFINQFDFEIETLEPEELLKLNIGQAYCRIGRNTFPLRVPKVDDHPDREMAEIIIETSRQKYGIPRIFPSTGSETRHNHQGDDPLAGLDPEEVFD
ncbi:hypothetical protein TRIP_C10075 [Candidatus Zixiibacteriota bacterium]|nr:hypothetical protein TRIP_C10075 [candidate division Zixibacteria bacterium]